MVFSQTHDWISTKPATVGNYTHCSISHSEEIKYIANKQEKQDNILKNKPKKKAYTILWYIIDSFSYSK